MCYIAGEGKRLSARSFVETRRLWCCNRRKRSNHLSAMPRSRRCLPGTQSRTVGLYFFNHSTESLLPRRPQDVVGPTVLRSDVVHHFRIKATNGCGLDARMWILCVNGIEAQHCPHCADSV